MGTTSGLAPQDLVLLRFGTAAIVPAVTLLIGIFVTQETPSAAEGTGAGLATLGLVTAIGLISTPIPSRG